MRIGFDYTAAVHQTAGIGRYVRELVTALTQVESEFDYRLFVAAGVRPPDRLPDVSAPPFGDSAAQWQLRSTRLTRRWLERLWYRLRLPLPVETWTGRVDLFHAPDFVLPPTRPQTRTLVTIYDLSFVRLPDITMTGMTRYLNRWVPHSVRQANHVIAISESTRQDLIELYHTPPAKISVLYPGLTPQFKPSSPQNAPAAIETTLRQTYGLGQSPFILSVGTVQPRKNYQRLIQAFAELVDEPSELLLVIVGGAGWQAEPIYQTVEQLGLSQRVRFLGYVSDAELSQLYRMAQVFAYPSLYEGFGLPALEALACGTPVVAANTTALPEVVGQAGLLVDPLDVAALRDALQRLLTDESLRQTLIARGYVQADKFSWTRTAQELVRLYGDYNFW